MSVKEVLRPKGSTTAALAAPGGDLSGSRRPPGAPTHAQMSLSVKLPLPPSDWSFLRNGVLVYVGGERDRGQGGHPPGSVQDSSDCRIELAAVAVASEKRILLARAQAHQLPRGACRGCLELPVGLALALDQQRHSLQ